MTSHLTFLITGANRGIGKGLVQTFLSRPSTTVIAAVRDPHHRTSEALAELPRGTNSNLITVKLDSAIPADAGIALASLERDHGITSLDVVIANAGIAANGTTVRESSVNSIQDHLKINTVAPVVLFQATADLLQKSNTGNPRFIAITSSLGSIGTIETLFAAGLRPVASPYGGSKAALNWFVRRLHFEEPWLTSFVIHPGLVGTEMADGFAAASEKSLAELGVISVEESVEGIAKVVDAATRDTSGKFMGYDGKTNPW